MGRNYRPQATHDSPVHCHKYASSSLNELTHWGRVTHICDGNLTIIGPDNGLSPGRRQAIIWTNAGILLIRPLGTNFNEMLIKILTFSFMKMRLKVSSAKWRPFCLGLNVLNLSQTPTAHCSQVSDTVLAHVTLMTCPPLSIGNELSRQGGIMEGVRHNRDLLQYPFRWVIFSRCGNDVYITK